MIDNEEKNKIDKQENKREENHQWSSRFDFFVTLLGYSFGLPDIWRLPYLAYRNGGGAFIFPYIFLMLLCGTPLYFLEIAMTQYSGKGPWKLWDICPLFRGFAIAILVINALNIVYDAAMRSWIVEYLVNSFRSELPWVSCDNWWNTPACISIHDSNQVVQNVSTTNSYLNISVDYSTLMNATSNMTKNQGLVSATEEFWRYKVLRQSTGIDDVGDINEIYVLYHFVIRLIVFLACIKSVKSLGKMMYITALLPIVFTTIIWIRSLLLPGSAEGMLYFITPDFSKIWELKVWIEAAFMTFYTLGPGWGGLMMMGCHNNFRTNCLRASLATSCSTLLYGVFNGLVVFSVVGVMAKEAGIPISQTIESGGFSIGFVAYPKALSYFPFPQIWCVLFYLVLLLPGIDAMTVEVEPIMLVLEENFKKLRNRRPLVLGTFSVVMFGVGLPFATQAGVYYFQLMDWFVATFSIMFICLVESIVFSWVYGAHRIDRDITLMLGRKVPVLIRVSCAFIMPIFLLFLLVISIYLYRPPTLGQYTYPEYANVLGWFIAMTSIVPIIVYAVVAIIKQQGSFRQRFLSLLRSNSGWKPAESSVLGTFQFSETLPQLSWKEKFIYNLTGRGRFENLWKSTYDNNDEMQILH